MNKELKEQAHKEFEEMLAYPSDNELHSISDQKIMKENDDKHLYYSDAYPESIWEIDSGKVLVFIDSLIDKTVQMTEERIAGRIDELIKDVTDYKEKSGLYAARDIVTLQDN